MFITKECWYIGMITHRNYLRYSYNFSEIMKLHQNLKSFFIAPTGVACTFISRIPGLVISVWYLIQTLHQIILWGFAVLLSIW
jgi:hypothetical protein